MVQNVSRSSIDNAQHRRRAPRLSIHLRQSSAGDAANECSSVAMLDMASQQRACHLQDERPQMAEVVRDMLQPDSLPPGWTAVFDEAKGRREYTNMNTGDVQYEHPLVEYYRGAVFMEGGECAPLGMVTGGRSTHASAGCAPRGQTAADTAVGFTPCNCRGL